MISSNGTRTLPRNGVVGVEADVDFEDVVHLTGVSGRGHGRPAPRLTLGRYTFKIAETPDEIEQVHRLNYETFAEEVGQYPESGSGQLVDKFHEKNTYFVAIEDGKVVGMMATHDQPPFSVAARLADPHLLDRLGTRLLEARLFAIRPDKRMGPVTRGVLWLVFEYGLANNYSHLIISGISSRCRMYERMGFRPLGPAVRDGDAEFVPMAMSLKRVPNNIARDAQRIRRRVLESFGDQSHAPVSLLPGPVHIADKIRHAVSQRPESHRGPSFIERFENTRRILSDMVGGLQTAIVVGSGTLANEIVGATLAADRSLARGLILRNGEFGRRLASQGARFGLSYETLEWDWGRPWNLDDVRAALDRHPDINWIWAVHLETSSGLVNNIDGLLDLAAPRGVRVCLDCVSSLGAIEMDLSRAHMATGVSGKSIGALAGLAFVFAHEGATARVDDTRVPTYFDLRATLETVGPRFTVSSPTMNALVCAIDDFATPERRRERYVHYNEMGRYVRKRLNHFGLTPMVEGPDAAPVITTFRPPAGVSSQEFCDMCMAWGFEISGMSGYLLDRGVVQIATMGSVTQRDCARLFSRLRSWTSARREMAGV